VQDERGRALFVAALSLYLMISTFHTYAELLHSGDRLAQTCWDGAGTLGEAVAATVRYSPDAVILRASANGQQLLGLAPGGLA
jgi:hypothetical protein